MSIFDHSVIEPREVPEREESTDSKLLRSATSGNVRASDIRAVDARAADARATLDLQTPGVRGWFERRRNERRRQERRDGSASRAKPTWQRWVDLYMAPAAARNEAEGEENHEETREAELIVAIFRTLVLLIAVFGPQLLHRGGTSDRDHHEIWLAAVAGLYNILTGLGCLFPSRYGLRRPFIVTMDLLLITLWIQLTGQWELRPFYYIVVVVAAMWYRVLGGLLAASFCNFFFLYIWSRAAADSVLQNPPVFTTNMAINTAMLFFVGCLVGYIAEAQERERERRLEDQLLIANYQREIDLSSQLQPALLGAQFAHADAPAWNSDSMSSPEAVGAQPVPELQVGAAMKTARTLGGGDYFDLIPLSEGRLGLCIADVSGKSVRAQARLPLLKYSLRALAPLYLQPDKLIERLNETLSPDLQPELYIALCYIVLDPRRETLSWCNAGHIAPLLLMPPQTNSTTRSTLVMINPESETQSTAEPTLAAPQPTALETDGPAVGMFPDMLYESHSLPWCPGSQLLLYTDGFSDAFSYRGSEDGEAQVHKLVARVQVEAQREAREVAQELVDLASAVLDDSNVLERAQSAFAHTPFKYDEELSGDPDPKHRDDITVVLVRYTNSDNRPRVLVADATTPETK